LLSLEGLNFVEYHDTSKRPKYVIASHRWFDNEEATFEDVQKGQNIEQRGYAKIRAFAQYIKDNIPAVKWLRIDTCCINKDSAAEPSETINSMFDWFRDAEVCLAYLADVETAEDRFVAGTTHRLTSSPKKCDCVPGRRVSRGSRHTRTDVRHDSSERLHAGNHETISAYCRPESPRRPSYVHGSIYWELR
jgi:hypothetical protein